jgi:hypothetical protein
VKGDPEIEQDVVFTGSDKMVGDFKKEGDIRRRIAPAAGYVRRKLNTYCLTLHMLTTRSRRLLPHLSLSMSRGYHTLPIRQGATKRALCQLPACSIVRPR